MIRSFRHKGLRALYEDGTARRIAPMHVEKLRDILALLDRSTGLGDMNLPGFRLHALRGRLAGFWSIQVSGNWRVIFRYRDGDVADVDYLDYH